MRKKLLIATNNAGKVAELRQMLGEIPVDLVSLAEFPNAVEVEETGDTYAENARLKAIGYATQTGLPALADDSGLSVDALDGRPGVLSARYGGENTSFTEKMRLLLSELNEAGESSRTARFTSSLVVADAAGNSLFEANGICEGRIADEPRGTRGFGYDPIFVPDGFEQTFGELDNSVKERISHRAAAFRQIIPFLRHFAAV